MTSDDRTVWAPVWAMALGVTNLSTAEILPVSLLTPMARDLSVSTGTAGQAMTATAGVAVAAALIIAWATQRVDRRLLLLVLTALPTLASLVVALAPTFALVMAARVLVGISLGGFWALSAALALRLAKGPDVPRALSIIFGGSSLAGVAVAPLASFMGGVIGWRGVFLIATGLGVVALAAQALTLPAMPPRGSVRLDTMLAVVRRRTVLIGLVGMFLTFGGSRLFYSYIRPFIDRTVGGDVALVSLLLLAYGVAVFVGTTQAAPLHRRNLRLTIAGASLLITALAFALVFTGTAFWPATIALIGWGLAYGVIPVGWTTWITRAVADQAETAGGLQVAVIQGAILAGAAAGGLIVDRFTITGVLIGSGVVTLVAAIHVLTQLGSTEPLRVTIR